MAKINHDKYYTPDDVAKYCIDKTFEIIGKENISDIIEPSAGGGAFSRQVKCTAYDIEPECEGIIKQDYLELNLPYKKGRLVIGNPPFGRSSIMIKHFCNKSFDIADYVGFILPVSCYNKSTYVYKFDLIHSELLNSDTLYSGVNVPCCLNIYKRPESGYLNEKHDYKKSNHLFEFRYVSDFRVINWKHDFAVCTWNEIHKSGKLVECKVGEYAKVCLIRIKNKNNFDTIKQTILDIDWRDHIQFQLKKTTYISVSDFFNVLNKVTTNKFGEVKPVDLTSFFS